MVEGVSRRAVLGGVLASAAVANSEAGEDPIRQLNRKIECLEALLQRAYGGRWETRVSFEKGYVSVSRSYRSISNSAKSIIRS